MAVVFAEHELHNACQVLFGTDLQVSRSFLDYLQLSGIKSAYRKKALETHPDVYIKESQLNGVNGDLFMAVQQAYESLVSFIDARKKGCIIQAKTSKSSFSHSQNQNSRPANSYKKNPPTSTPFSTYRRKTKQKATPRPAPQYTTVQRTGPLHKGPIPNRKLLFGHYLYYSGLVNWQTIIKALVWQRTRRPRIGEIGCSYGWLSPEDILFILKSRSLSDSFGKSAVHHGFLTESQLRLLVFQQKKLQKKFGEYFVANNILSKTQVNRLVQQFRNHNHIAGSRKHRYRDM